MRVRLPWSIQMPVRMAWREASASPGRCALAIVAMTIGIAAMYGVRSLTVELSAHLVDAARQWVGADIILHMPMGHAPTSEEIERIRGLDRKLRLTVLTESATVVSSKQSPDPVSAYIQAVDPAIYPFYGKLRLKSGTSVSEKLDSSGALVTEALMGALQVGVGDRIRIRRSEFIIRDVITSEPGLVAAFSEMIPHVILSEEGLNRTGLVRFGGNAFYRVLLRTPSDAVGLALCPRLEAEFPGAEISHYTSVVRPISDALEWAIPAMNTLSLLCLAFGSMGIAIVTYLHLLRQFETIAIFKSLGATSAQVLNIYLLQVVLFALIACALGIPSGMLIERTGFAMAERYLGFEIIGQVHGSMIVESVVLGLSAASAAAWLPLSQLRKIRPSVLLRRDAGERSEAGRSFLERSEHKNRASRIGFAMGMLILAYVASLSRGLYFLGGLSIILAAIYLLTRTAMEVPFAIARRTSLRLPFLLRQAASNLYRFRRQSRMVALALASGAALSVIGFLIQREVGAHLLDMLPLHGSNLLFGNVGVSQRGELDQALLEQTGLKAEWTPIAWLTLSRANGSGLEQLRAAHPGSWVQRVWPTTCSSSAPAAAQIVAGHWWTRNSGVPSAALEQNIATLLGVGIGSHLEFLKNGKLLAVRVAAIIHQPAVLRALYGITLDCNRFEDLDPVSYGGVYVNDHRLNQLRHVMQNRFPGLWIVESGDLLRWTQRIGTEASRGVQFSAALAVIMAMFLMLALMRILHSFRVYEFAVLRTIGARPRTLLAVGTLEYLVLGGLAGFTGVVCGAGGTTVVLAYITGKLTWNFNFPSAVLVTAGTALITGGMGFVDSFILLRSTPLEVLRWR
jgi:putative ABC transport system permease protein